MSAKSDTNKRIFCGSFSVRMGAKRVRFEIAKASLFGGGEGLYRVRMARRWLMDAEGNFQLFDKIGLASLIANMALEDDVAAIARPELQDKMRVSVYVGDDVYGFPRYEGTWTSSPPILASDGRWHIAVFLIKKGVVFVPCDDVIMRKK